MVKTLPTIERSTKIRFGKHVQEDQGENTIVLNASNTVVDATDAGAVYITPVRNFPGYVGKPEVVLMMYNTTTKELTESGESAQDIIGNVGLNEVANQSNATSNTIIFYNNTASIVTTGNVGIANALASHTLSVGSNLYVDDTGSNVLVVAGSVSIAGDLTINGGTTLIKTDNLVVQDPIIEIGQNNITNDTTLDLGLIMARPGSNVVVGFREVSNEFVLAYTQSSASSNVITPIDSQDLDVHIYGGVLTESNVGIKTTTPDAELHVVGNVYVSSNITIDTDTFHVDSVADHVGINTKNPNAGLHVVGNVYVSSNVIIANANLTVDTDTFHVDSVNDSIGVGTVNPNANLHVVGNVYVSSNLTVDTDTFHVDSVADHVGINTKNPDAELHVVGNVYISSNVIIANANLTVDTDTFHVDSVADHVGINTKNPDAELHVVGNVYVSSNVIIANANLTVDTDTFHVDSVADHVGINTKNPDAELHVVGNVYVSSNVIIANANLTVDTDTFHVDSVADHVGINTKNPDAELHVVGNVYVSSNVIIANANLTVDTDTFHVDSVADHVGINTKNPDAELHVVGNVYVSSNLTVDTDTFHVDVEADHVGINTKNPNAELHVVGNVYVSSNLTVDTDTFHVDVEADHVGINTKNPTSDLHVVGNAYVSSTTNSTTTTTGALIIAGGIGVAGQIYGQHANLEDVEADSVNVTDTTVSSSKTTGALIVVGGLGVAANIHTSNIYAGYDADETSYIGRSAIGFMGQSDHASFAHVDNNTTANYAIKQSAAGTTHLNAKSGQNVSFKINNDEKARVTSGGDFYVNTNTLYVDASTSRVGLDTDSPNANLHAVGNVYVGSTTNSTTTTTGALIIAGGIGVAGQIFGQHANLEDVEADSITITDVATSTTTTSGALKVTGGISTQENVHVGGVAKVHGDTISDGKTAGALIVVGGVGISGALFGSTAEFDGITKVTNTTQASNQTSGALIVSGGLGVAGNVHCGNLTLTGNLTVSGNTTVVNTDNLIIQDPIIELGKDNTTGTDLGIIMSNPLTGGNKGNVAIIYDFSTSKLEIGHTLNSATDAVITMNTANTIPVNINGTLEVTGTNTSTTKDTGALIITTGGVGIEENLNVGGVTKVWDTTDAGATNEGALQVVGGLGVAKTVFAADVSSGSVTVTDNSTSTTKDTGALIITTGGVGIEENLNVGGFTKVWDNSTSTTTTSGALKVVGGVGIVENLNVGGVTKVWDTTDAGATNEGALQVVGGLGVAKTVFAADVSSGSVTVTDNSTSTTKDTGALIVTIGGVGIEENLNVGGVTKVWDNSTSTTTTSGALKVAGGVGVVENLNVGGFAKIAYDQDVTSYLGRAAIGFVSGFTDQASFAHIDHNTSSNYAIRQNNSGKTHLNAKAGESIVFKINNAEKAKLTSGGDFLVDTDTLYVDASEDRVGINKAAPAYALDVVGDINSSTMVKGATISGTNVYGTLAGSNAAAVTTLTASGVVTLTNADESTSSTQGGALKVAGGVGIAKDVFVGERAYVTGGLITNTGGVGKKTYSYSAELASGASIANATYVIDFTNHSFHAKVTAMLIESADEISTMIFDVIGGIIGGSGNSAYVPALGQVSVINTSTMSTQWDHAVVTALDGTTVTIKPGTTCTGTVRFNIFVEYLSHETAGQLTSVTNSGTSAGSGTFGY